uniref:Uncharacterized protein n=1 Tax=Anopheles albimanus TaxID=7167 RepID=A0A182FYV8_ANOAL
MRSWNFPFLESECVVASYFRMDNITYFHILPPERATSRRVRRPSAGGDSS